MCASEIWVYYGLSYLEWFSSQFIYTLDFVIS